MKRSISFLFVFFLITFSVFGQGWSSMPGPYGENIQAGFSQSTYGVFSFTGTSSSNMLGAYLAGSQHSKNFSNATPIAILSDMRLAVLVGADSVSVTKWANIQNQGMLGKISGAFIYVYKNDALVEIVGARKSIHRREGYIYVAKVGDLINISAVVTLHVSSEMETFPLEVPSEYQSGNVVETGYSILSISDEPTSVQVELVVDNLRFQYDYAGNVVIVDPFGDPTDVGDPTETPSEFSLAQNYPNPFNPNTAIRYSVQGTSHVKLSVYDVLGNEVVTLVNEEKPAGEYEIEFDGTNLSSGTYFATFSAGSHTKFIKMTLLK